VTDYSQNIIKVPRFNEASGFYTTKERSKLMSKIKSQDTKPEQKLRKFLWGIGIRYRKNVKKMPGTPDIVISKYKLVIFVDGEFWHGFNWKEKKEKIKSNRAFWIPKIERNMQRDRMNEIFYIKKGWKVMRFWEHEIKKEFNVCVSKILDYLDAFPDHESS
jgi:DNA mismatch endonuclease (patch repair protein)